jgi:hypothetical protein
MANSDMLTAYNVKTKEKCTHQDAIVSHPLKVATSLKRR